MSASTSTDPQWIVVLDTGRFGDWIVVRAPDAEAATKKLTRTQRKKVAYVRRHYTTAENRARRERGEIGKVGKGRRRR